MVRIDSTRFGSITIDGKIYSGDVFVTWNGNIERMETSTRHLLGKSELEILLRKEPEVLIVGTGVYGYFNISDDVIGYCKEKGIEYIETKTKDAIRKFNEHSRQGKKVVAYFHVTC